MFSRCLWSGSREHQKAFTSMPNVADVTSLSPFCNGQATRGSEDVQRRLRRRKGMLIKQIGLVRVKVENCRTSTTKRQESTGPEHQPSVRPSWGLDPILAKPSSLIVTFICQYGRLSAGQPSWLLVAVCSWVIANVVSLTAQAHANDLDKEGALASAARQSKRRVLRR